MFKYTSQNFLDNTVMMCSTITDIRSQANNTARGLLKVEIPTKKKKRKGYRSSSLFPQNRIGG